MHNKGINILHHLHSFIYIIFKDLQSIIRYSRLIVPRHSQRVLDDQIFREIAGEHEGNLSNPWPSVHPGGKHRFNGNSWWAKA